MKEDIPTTYELVPKTYLRAMLAALVILLLMCFYLGYLIYVSQNDIQALREFDAKEKERNAAMDEMLLNRAEPQQWVYDEVCNIAIREGRACLPRQPKWWADPKKYPLLINDPSGTGLFPRMTPSATARPTEYGGGTNARPN